MLLNHTTSDLLCEQPGNMGARIWNMTRPESETEGRWGRLEGLEGLSLPPHSNPGGQVVRRWNRRWAWPGSPSDLR